MTKPRSIDLTFRPVSYKPPSLNQEQLLSRIRGKARREIATRLLKEEGFKGLTTFMAREQLTDEDREAWGRIHPQLMGGEYLPDLDEGEVEIARISLPSTTGDQISVRARPVGNRIHYRIVDEYHDEPGMQYRLPIKQSKLTLTLADLIRLIDGARIPGRSGGVVRGFWEDALENGGSADEAVRRTSVSSAFYPDLSVHYNDVGDAWLRERSTDEHHAAGEIEPRRMGPPKRP